MGIKGKKRLFLALWPDDFVRNQLNSLLKSTSNHVFDGKAVHQENLHMTLLFLGDVGEEDRLNLIAALDHILFDPFQLTINRWGHFHKPGILWLGVADNVEPLRQLLNQIKSCVSKTLNGIAITRFTPHITMLRNTKTLPQVNDFEAFDWNVESFVLVQSKLRQESVEYCVLHEWKA